ncbi:MAG: hypothetical protein NTX24_05260 [Candidatus Pacearchaeota archaeon]|nr:hypothetical protein [Candidatus Pacearchaeota archaeon]
MKDVKYSIKFKLPRIRKIIKERNKKYLIDGKIDQKIFDKIKKLEKKKLNRKDKETIRFIKTQLEKNWGKHALKELYKLDKKN